MVVRTLMPRWFAPFAAILVLASVPAWADLYSAGVAYQKGDFASAFQQFKELAELGQPDAQYNLAVMYTRGEGVEENHVYAHAWASLAGQNGEAKGAALAAQLEPNLTPVSLRISGDIQAQWSSSTLNARLLPRFANSRVSANREADLFHDESGTGRLWRQD